MKIILLEDVKNKGKKNDIIDVKDGYANFLITTHKANLATNSNLENLEEQLLKEKETKEKELSHAQEAKVILEGISNYTLLRKLDDSRKSIKHITKSQVAEIILSTSKIEIDKKDIELPDSINLEGEHLVIIKLHSSVKAQIKVLVKAL